MSISNRDPSPDEVRALEARRDGIMPIVPLSEHLTVAVDTARDITTGVVIGPEGRSTPVIQATLIGRNNETGEGMQLDVRFLPELAEVIAAALVVGVHEIRAKRN